MTSLFLLCAAGIAAFYVSGRSEIIPDRPRFVAFPGTDRDCGKDVLSLLEPEIERALSVSMTTSCRTTRDRTARRSIFTSRIMLRREKASQPHSPIDCIPGSGWQITKFERTSYTDNGAKFPLNRVIIERNSTRQLVYYWFDERGRKIANEYLAKWYLHADAIVMNRTDGALVRLITQIHDGETERDADRASAGFHA